MRTVGTPPTSEARTRARLKQELTHLWPELTHFYGLAPAELATTPKPILQLYIDALPRLLAREQLSAIQAAGSPHMEKSARGRMMRELWRQAGFSEPQATPVQSHDAIAALGIPVTVVDKDGNPVEEHVSGA